MQNRKDAIVEIYEKHKNAIFITTTGFISRAMFELFPNNKNIFYMKGSMGLAPAIGLGISEFSKKEIVVINGDGAHLMHLGIGHTIKDRNNSNLFVYILDNGCHESVGGQPCSSLEKKYPGVNHIFKISCDGKTPRVGKSFKENAKEIINYIKE